MLAEREFQSRYKQTVLGIVWALLTPVLLVLVFAVFVNRAFDINTGDAPYILFAYIGLIPWNFFSFSLTRGGQSLVLDSGVINKVRCPREVFPLAGMASAGIDMVISLFVLGALFIVTGFELKTTVVWVPLIFLLQLVFVAGIVMVFAILGVYFRDLYQAMPLLLQLGLLATPVAYGIEAIPEKWWSIYARHQSAGRRHRELPPDDALRVRAAVGAVPARGRGVGRVARSAASSSSRSSRPGIADVA